MKEATFNDSEIRTRSASWTVDYPIADLRVVDGVIAVIYDYMAGPKHRQFENLQGFDDKGNLLWTAQHPTNNTADAYVNFTGGSETLEAWNFACYSCRIDPRNGHLLHAQFTK